MAGSSTDDSFTFLRVPRISSKIGGSSFLMLCVISGRCPDVLSTLTSISFIFCIVVSAFLTVSFILLYKSLSVKIAPAVPFPSFTLFVIDFILSVIDFVLPSISLTAVEGILPATSAILFSILKDWPNPVYYILYRHSLFYINLAAVRDYWKRW